MNRRIYTQADIDQIPTLDFRSHPAEPGVFLPMRRPWRRLASVDYRDPDCVCLVTACTRDRLPVFADARFAQLAKDLLVEQAIRVQYRLFAYAIMPDHVHIVLAPSHSGWTIGRIIGRWKSYVTYRFKQMGKHSSPWQRDYDDRALRASEEHDMGLQRMIGYVLENPVRKGLAADWKQYPYCGCFVDM